MVNQLVLQQGLQAAVRATMSAGHRISPQNNTEQNSTGAGQRLTHAAQQDAYA